MVKKKILTSIVHLPTCRCGKISPILPSSVVPNTLFYKAYNKEYLPAQFVAVRAIKKRNMIMEDLVKNYPHATAAQVLTD
jgi:hypothetical protein